MPRHWHAECHRVCLERSAVLSWQENSMIPSTVQRVPEHTAAHVNEAIRLKTEENVARYADAGPEAVERRLEELDREWDIERTLEANAASVALIGLTLGATVN